MFGFIPNFFFFNNWVGVHVLFLESKVFGVEGAFPLMPLMLFKWERSHFCFFFFNLISFESFKSSMSLRFLGFHFIFF